MQVAIITDTHFGVKSGDKKWLDSQLRFFREELIPYCRKHSITDIIHTGDLFNDRETTDNRVFDAVFKLFNEDLAEFNVTVIEGNHDSYYNSRTDVTICNFLTKFDNVTLVTETMLKDFDGLDVLLVPWQTDWEKFAVEVANKNTDCKVCMGHLPISGFLMNSKMASPHGVKPEVFFKNFKRTFSGHYHTRSEKSQNGSKIIYPGNTYHLTRHDIGDSRGMCIFNTSTLTHTYIASKKTIKYIKIDYPQKVTKAMVKGNIVDIHVKYDENYNEKEFLEFVGQVEAFEPLEEPYIKGEQVLEMNELENEEEYTSTLDLIKTYVDIQTTIEDPVAVKDIIEDLYDNSLEGAE